MSELEGRLSGIERALYHLVNKTDGPKRKKRSSIRRRSMPSTTRSSSRSDGTDSTDSSDSMQEMDSNTVHASSNEHLGLPLRGCSLASLCGHFRDVVSDTYLEHNVDNPSSVSGMPSVHAMMCQLFQYLDSKTPLEISKDGLPVDLPPRSLLAMACIPFFQSGDLATDLFDQDFFRQNVDRIYGSPYRSEDTAWAACFNLIILLGLGVDQPASSQGDFLRPFLLNAMRCYVSMTTTLTPGIIEVQALTLLVSDDFHLMNATSPTYSAACNRV